MLGGPLSLLDYLSRGRRLHLDSGGGSRQAPARILERQVHARLTHRIRTVTIMNQHESIDDIDQELITECRTFVDQQQASQEMMRYCRRSFVLLFIMGSLPVVILAAYFLINSGSIGIDWEFLIDPGFVFFYLWFFSEIGWTINNMIWWSKYVKLCRLVVMLQVRSEGSPSEKNNSRASAPPSNLFAESSPHA
jgi:hypothetical protein